MNTDNTDDPGALKAKIALLEKDLQRHQESYISRERAYKTRIDELDEELSRQRQRKTGWMKTDAKMSKLKAMQGQITSNVELVQDRTARILQEQERDLLRAFRARLFDVQTELEKEKSKKDDGAGAWIERSRQLEAEVEWAKEVADRLERVNHTLSAENTRLKAQFKSQEEDRNYLIKQLVAIKKDNARLRAEYMAIEQENAALQEQVKSAEDGNKTTILPRVPQSRTTDQEERYKEANTRLRKLLADERRSLQQVRQNYAQELKSRTDMEMLLRACVEDVRKEIARRHIETAQLGTLMKGVSQGEVDKIYNGNGASNIPIEAFAQEDRERALELLLSQERVVTLLYSKVFPVSSGAKSKGPQGGTSSGIEDLLHEDEEDRPNTTGGLPSAINATSGTRPHTINEDVSGHHEH
eukprot:CAMPEP_0185034910 /NCGR_PEP_ID=MMETSP1103-20130426/25338_1 /TAXON_ID=36769 /ORGANISM="Paraphysomonas bandaiensis, Strain Caron Lab Isolate" /LENGTH=412 /DNA_ID=CAMNT_0027571755 /DNA_START=158 /DNA_END=1396 /DNA_ORIENTATION=-